MSGFFEEYGWTVVSMIGGIMGVELFFKMFYGADSMLSGVLEALLQGLM